MSLIERFSSVKSQKPAVKHVKPVGRPERQITIRIEQFLRCERNPERVFISSTHLIGKDGNKNIRLAVAEAVIENDDKIEEHLDSEATAIFYKFMKVR